MPGPLHGVRVVEMGGIGPGPFCAMMLADMGAEVVRLDRKGSRPPSKFDVLARGRPTISIDLKDARAQSVALALIARADALVEGFRPGVMERLGLGPDRCLELNPRLIYGRMTGWGQSGPLSHAAGHDLNYIALSGMLNAIGRANEPPPPPLNLIGDFGGGAMMLAFGIVCALLEARETKRGQVVDAAMTDGSALLGALMYGLKASGRWSVERGANLLDGAAHFYDTYECADGKFVAIGAIEPQFYAELLRKIGLDAPEFHPQMNTDNWSALKLKLAAHIKLKSRDEWATLLEGSDACFAPVLDMDEAPLHAHNVARKTFIEIDGVVQPAPAPRFSRTPAQVAACTQVEAGDALRSFGVSDAQVASWKAEGVV